jgi:hypothetical protein
MADQDPVVNPFNHIDAHPDHLFPSYSFKNREFLYHLPLRINLKISLAP